jgi:hypothetical protein
MGSIGILFLCESDTFYVEDKALLAPSLFCTLLANDKTLPNCKFVYIYVI